MASCSFRHFVEHDLGKVPHFIIYSVLELILICLLLLDGFVSLFAHEFARLFELELPCTLCTRIDQTVIDRDTDFYHESICEGHKKEISSLAYCHVHQKLACLRTMCEGCLLGYAPENNDTKQDKVDKNIDCLFDDELRARLMIPCWKNDDSTVGGAAGDKGNNANLCSCCGEPMKIKSSYPKGSIPSNVSRITQTPMPSPRTPISINNLDFNNLKLSRSNTLKMSRSNTLERDRGSNLRIQVLAPRKEDTKSVTIPTNPEYEGLTDDHTRYQGIPLPDSTSGSPRANKAAPIPFFSACTSPRFGNRSTPPSLSGASSPRFAQRTPRKSMLERMELAPDPFDNIGGNEPEESVLNRLKTQVKLDQKSLVALYMELDEERSAAAVAANNAMAMITRLQAEKASVQMEALQYQRMMDEQAEYDQEALLSMKDLLDRREDEMRELEAELELYRERYGMLRDPVRFNSLEKLQSFESFTEGIERGSHHDRSGLDLDEYFDHENDYASFCSDTEAMALPEELLGYNSDNMLSDDLKNDTSYSVLDQYGSVVGDVEEEVEVGHENQKGEESSIGLADALDQHTPMVSNNQEEVIHESSSGMAESSKSLDQHTSTTLSNSSEEGKVSHEQDREDESNAALAEKSPEFSELATKGR